MLPLATSQLWGKKGKENLRDYCSNPYEVVCNQFSNFTLLRWQQSNQWVSMKGRVNMIY